MGLVWCMCDRILTWKILFPQQALEGVGGLRYYEMVYQWSRKRSQLLVSIFWVVCVLYICTTGWRRV